MALRALSDCVASMTDWVGKVNTLYHTPNIKSRRKEIKSVQQYENISFMTDGCHCEKIMRCVVIAWWTTKFFRNNTNLEMFISHQSLLLGRVEWEYIFLTWELVTCIVSDVNDELHSLLIKICKEVNFHQEKKFAISDGYTCKMEKIFPPKVNTMYKHILI